MDDQPLEVVSAGLEDRAWIDNLMMSHWGSTRMATRGRLHEVPELPSLIAVLANERVGLLSYHVAGEAGEIVLLGSLVAGRGIGSALLEPSRAALQELGCRRAWLITTNDNITAIRFYRARGWMLAAIHRDAVTRTRALKPEIPLLGKDGIMICDELEFEYVLSSSHTA